MNSNTPRTDAEAFTVVLNGDTIVVVTAETAAKMERELAESNRILDEAKKVFVEVDKVTDELDRWKEVAEELRVLAVCADLSDEDLDRLVAAVETFDKLKEASK